MKILSAILFTTICVSHITAQEITLEENFDEGIPSSWSTFNMDGHTPAEIVTEFTAAWIPYTVDGDTCVASTSYYDPAGQAEDFLVTEKFEIGNFSKLV